MIQNVRPDQRLALLMAMALDEQVRLNLVKGISDWKLSHRSQSNALLTSNPRIIGRRAQMIRQASRVQGYARQVGR